MNTTSRRGFLTKGAATVAGGAAILAMQPSQASPVIVKPSLDGARASPALRNAVVDLREAHETLEAAKARFAADDAKVSEWSESHPKPLNSRARKRWARKWNEYRETTVFVSWEAQIEAENNFREAQKAVAAVTPRDWNDLTLKAAVAAVYDKTQTEYNGSVAIISYSVAWDLFKLRNPA